jgi:hypothetical protein
MAPPLRRCLAIAPEMTQLNACRGPTGFPDRTGPDRTGQPHCHYQNGMSLREAIYMQLELHQTNQRTPIACWKSGGGGEASLRFLRNHAVSMTPALHELQRFAENPPNAREMYTEHTVHFSSKSMI